MKKSFFFLLLFTISACFANSAFAGDAIPGVSVKAGKNPGGQLAASSKTDKGGSFSVSLPAGNYDLTISFSDVQKALSSSKNWDGKSVTLSYSNSDIKTLVPLKVTITKNSPPISITVHSKNATISGKLTY